MFTLSLQFVLSNTEIKQNLPEILPFGNTVFHKKERKKMYGLLQID